MDAQTRLLHSLESLPACSEGEADGQRVHQRRTLHFRSTVRCKNILEFLTAQELDRFRKYARRMRELQDNHSLPLEVLSDVNNTPRTNYCS